MAILKLCHSSSLRSCFSHFELFVADRHSSFRVPKKVASRSSRIRFLNTIPPFNLEPRIRQRSSKSPCQAILMWSLGCRYAWGVSFSLPPVVWGRETWWNLWNHFCEMYPDVFCPVLTFRLARCQSTFTRSAMCPCQSPAHPPTTRSQCLCLSRSLARRGAVRGGKDGAPNDC